MTSRRWLAAFLFLSTALSQAVDLKNRSTSSTGQFVVYCDDRPLRGRVVTFAEDVKADVLRILQLRDSWSMPVVVTMEAADPGMPAQPVIVQLVNTVAGPKIDIVVRVGGDPSKVFLQRHIIRAVLLEIMYRDRPRLRPDERYAEAPWWVVQGIIESLRWREQGADADVFKSIAQADKLPLLDTMLEKPSALLDTTAGTVDRACALCLFEALLSLPEGAQKLRAFLVRWPDARDGTMAALRHHFPELNESPSALAKWWTLQITRFAAGSQWQGQSLAETDRALTAALQLAVAMDNKGRVENFPIADFEKYVKLPGARNALNACRVHIVTLSTSANPLFRPILAEYEAIAGALSTLKTKGIAKRIADIEAYRASLLTRMEQITDYMNWYEATQPDAQAGDFEKFLRVSADLEKKEAPVPLPPVDPRITEYLDEIEKELAPLTPDTIPGGTPSGAASR